MRQGLLMLAALAVSSATLAAADAPITTTKPSYVTTGPLPADANTQSVVQPLTTSPVSTAQPEASTAVTSPASATSAAGAAPAAVQNNGTEIPSFVGVYHCKGIDPYLNKDYTGTVTVTQQNTVYRLNMQYDTGETALGTGGLYDKSLMSVVFQDSQDPKKVGLEQYHFTPDYKTMSGFWVYLGKDKLGKEICTKE